MLPDSEIALKFIFLQTGPLPGGSQNAVIRVYDDAGNVIETHEHKGEGKSQPDLSVLQAKSYTRVGDKFGKT
jgi:hypothetical protein